LIFEKKLLRENGWFILETSPRHDFTEHPKLLEVRNYGQTHFWFFGEEDTIAEEHGDSTEE
jgi:16S rRNA (guanine966-N2)-methyltransferase